MVYEALTRKKKIKIKKGCTIIVKCSAPSLVHNKKASFIDSKDTYRSGS